MLFHDPQKLCAVSSVSDLPKKPNHFELDYFEGEAVTFEASIPFYTAERPICDAALPCETEYCNSSSFSASLAYFCF